MFTKENLNIFKGFATFVREFLLLKHGGWILFVMSLIFGFWYTGEEKEKSLKEGKDSAVIEIASLKSTIESNGKENHILNGRVAFYKSKLDTCEAVRYSEKQERYNDLSREVDKALEIAKRNNKRLNKDLNNN
jgi:hypothetical protein